MATLAPEQLDVPRLNGMAPVVPLSLAQYHRMIEAGVIFSGAPLEFIEGYLIGKDRGRGHGMTHNPDHASTLSKLYRRIVAVLPADVAVRCQLPITLGPSDVAGAGSEPEPDLAVARGPEERYAERHPGPDDLRLVIEVADSSLAFDRRTKTRLYASHGICVYWIVNLVERRLEVFSDPDPVEGRFRSEAILADDQQVLLSWPEIEPLILPIADLLSPIAQRAD